MGDLSTELQALREQRRRTHADARPTPELRAGIARGRRIRAGLWGGGAAACAALLAVAAAPAVIDAVDPPPAPEPIPTSAPPEYAQATVPFDDPETGWLDDPLMVEPPFCGKPLPANLGARDGFRAQHALPDAVVMQQGIYSESVEASATIRYGRYDEFPVIVDPMVGLVASDGEVVGWLPGTSPRGLNTFVGGAATTVTWEGLGGYAVACREDTDAPPATLEPGEYELAWMTRVHASEDANARAHLSTTGYVIPPSRVAAAYREGSFECERRAAAGGDLPITCDPGAVPGTAIDLEAGEVTFPYPESSLGREVDVRFVSTRVPLTIRPQPTDPLDIIEQQNPGHVPGEPMACGDQYGRLDAGELSVTRTGSAMALPLRSDLAVTVWNDRLTWTEATVDLPPTARLWFTQREQRRAALNDGGSYGYTLHQVVGWADVTLPPRIELDRYEGPTSMTIGVGAITWCDGPPQVSDAALTLTVLAPHTITDDAGTRDVEIVRLD